MMEAHEVGELEKDIAEKIHHDSQQNKEMAEVDENDKKVRKRGSIDNPVEKSIIII